MEMDEHGLAFFFEIHSDLPREGPGDTESTRRAFSMMAGLPANPRILDVGCGPGMQTTDLADLCKGTIIALDYYPHYLDALRVKIREAELGDRVSLIRGDMSALGFKTETFDVIWSEGAVYLMGFKEGLRAWRPLLKTRGYLAVTEISWLRPDPPEELAGFWEEAYPAIKDIGGNLDAVREAGYRPVNSFILPESSWWDAYYRPIEEKLFMFRDKYKANDDALRFAAMEQAEMDLYREYAEYYGYVFYVMQKG
jgi:ubiquinone/menaquinone biosynthesis C-methylase UbiE